MKSSVTNPKNRPPEKVVTGRKRLGYKKFGCIFSKTVTEEIAVSNSARAENRAFAVGYKTTTV